MLTTVDMIIEETRRELARNLLKRRLGSYGCAWRLSSGEYEASYRLSYWSRRDWAFACY